MYPGVFDQKHPGDTQIVDFEITHACNLNCPLCDHRISSSGYAGLSREGYAHIRGCLGTFCEEVRRVGITGGEPLTHPDIEWLCGHMLHDFPRARLILRTNGLALHEFPKPLFKRMTFMVSWYVGVTDAVAERFADCPNVFFKKVEHMRDPFRDPSLSDATARALYDACPWHAFRLVGTRLYGCCLAESIERSYRTEGIGVSLSPDWRRRLSQVETWRACKHCYKAFELGILGKPGDGLSADATIKRA
jgi:hypothetical protein